MDGPTDDELRALEDGGEALEPFFGRGPSLDWNHLVYDVKLAESHQRLDDWWDFIESEHPYVRHVMDHHPEGLAFLKLTIMSRWN